MGVLLQLDYILAAAGAKDIVLFVWLRVFLTSKQLKYCNCIVCVSLKLES